MVQMHPTKTPFYYISLIEIGVLSAKIIYVRSLGLQSPNRYEIDLLNEVLNFDFDQSLEKVSANSADPGRMGSNQADRQMFL